ncbi:transposase [Clostridium sp. 19966]|uniref:transposase n=1 Tax=Clostridium sp. 19966 TaxID=2768166 RepID=UPI0028DF4FB4|nr:transposase [Clostridium sp. 19966]MDT8716171.1 transposase [Clostridium sp. 19966]
MPRTARKKDPSAIYHIMVRSISELNLFKDHEDKEKYLQLIKKYKSIYLFDVYCYCLMTTHGHIVINSCAADISKIMKSINQSYAYYYNHKYQRHGHVFQDRFKSKLVNNVKYLCNLTAYIHNNPKDIKKYKNDVSLYPFSSFGIYSNKFQDKYEIVNCKFILNLFNQDVLNTAANYFDYVNYWSMWKNDLELLKSLEMSDEPSQYISGRNIILRDADIECVINYVSAFTHSNFNPQLKYDHNSTSSRSLFIILLRCFSNLSLKDICSQLGNTTNSNVHRLFNVGYKLISSDDNYKNVIQDFIRLNNLSIA